MPSQSSNRSTKPKVTGSNPVGRATLVSACRLDLASGRSPASWQALVVLACASTAQAAPGELDPSFGDAGVVRLLQSEEKVSVKGVAVQPDDKIVLAGAEDPGNLLLFRLLPNGDPDLSFGVAGKVVMTLPGGFSEARAVTIQPDGKIVVVGSEKVPPTRTF